MEGARRRQRGANAGNWSYFIVPIPAISCALIFRAEALISEPDKNWGLGLANNKKKTPWKKTPGKQKRGTLLGCLPKEGGWREDPGTKCDGAPARGEETASAGAGGAVGGGESEKINLFAVR